MKRALLIVLTCFAVSFHVFPLNFFILPTVNVKQMLAVAGLVILGMNIVRHRKYELDKSLLYIFLISSLYSVVNLIAVEINDEFDFSYASYVTTFFVWTFSAYTVIEIIRAVHGKVPIRLLASYLATVGAAQSILAVLIDKVVFIETFIGRLTYTEFYQETGRLYGLGAALDPAGVRFSAILIFVAFVIAVDERIKQSTKSVGALLFCFGVTTMFGSMISRTTTVGAGLGLLVLVLSTGLYRLTIESQSRKLLSTLGTALIVLVPTAIILYNTDEFFYTQFRFAFEGFFNYVEQGEFRTHSTDILATMWRWPETTQGWIIGTGIFGEFSYGTDIGYCRFVLYSGLIGFSVFASLFVYCAYTFANRYPHYRYLFLMWLALSFIVWSKVSTDIYQFWAFFFVFIDYEELGTRPILSIR